MRKALLGAVSAIALAMVQPAWAFTTVYCTNCDTLTQQLLSYSQQLLQLENEVKTAEAAVANTLALPSTVYRDMTSEIRQIESIASQASMLSGKTADILGNLAKTGTYSAGSISAWQNQLINESNAISQAMRTAATILQNQNTSLGTNAATLANLQSQALGTGGQQATLQTLAGIQATVGQQIQSQQATTSAALQAMLTAQAAQAEREDYIRRLTTAQEQAGILAMCRAAAATGFPTAPACKNVLSQSGGTP
jgi:P-type conjugative transfer protein TrbJ